jgi:hypothetical protein
MSTDQPTPSVEQRYAALVAVATEVADKLEARGLHDLATRLHGAATADEQDNERDQG